MRYSYLFAAALGLAFLTPSWGQTPPRRTAAAARPTPRSTASAIPPTRVVAPVTADEDSLVEEEATEEVVLAPPVRRSKPTVQQTSTAQAEMQSQVAPRAAAAVQRTQAESVLSEPDGMEYEDEGYEGGYGGYNRFPYGGILGPGIGRNGGCRGPWFGDLDYVQWYAKGMNSPPLVSVIVDPAANPPQSAIIYPTGEFFTEARPGGRVRLGKWMNCFEQTAIMGEFFYLNDVQSSFTAVSDANGTPEYGRPFIDQNGTPSIEDVSITNLLRGSVTVDAESRFSGAGIWLRRNLGCENIFGGDMGDPCGEPAAIGSRRVDFICGYRHLRLDERMNIHESLTSLLPAPDQGSFEIDDTFGTKNSFHGADIGFQWDNYRGRWHLGLLTKVALGSVRERVRISGQTVTTGANDPADNGTRAGGLLAQTTNIGSYARDEFAIIPELGVNLGFQLTDRWRIQAGYTFLYWSRVVRPGDQIDNTINTTLIPNRQQVFAGAARPEFNFRDTDYWVQGFNLGLHFDF